MTDDGLHVLLPDDCVDLEQFFFLGCKWTTVAPDIRQNIPFYVSVSHKFIWKIEESAARLENKCVNNGPLNSYK